MPTNPMPPLSGLNPTRPTGQDLVAQIGTGTEETDTGEAEGLSYVPLV